MTKEITKSAAELEAMPIDVRAMPNEILMKIFNFLPNHDIRRGVSLVCKKFYEICQDESLVPVKDLCIYGHPVGPKSKKKGQIDKQHYCLSGARVNRRVCVL